MTATFARDMPHTASYWARAGQDAAGGWRFAAPVTVACRWEERGDVYTNSIGQQAVSQSVVYVSREVDIGDWLAKDAPGGADPRRVKGAHEIKSRTISPDLRGAEQLVKAIL